MVSDSTYTAVFDRFEGDLAVLLLEDDGEVDQLVAEQDELPKDGRHQDAIFRVRVRDDELQRIRYDPDTTENRKTAAQDRFDRLSRRFGDDEE